MLNMSVSFSTSLIEEYTAEMLSLYDVSLTALEAQEHLKSLVNMLFPLMGVVDSPPPIRAHGCRESDGRGRRYDAGDVGEVGRSITPTSGQTKL